MRSKLFVAVRLLNRVLRVGKGLVVVRVVRRHFFYGSRSTFWKPARARSMVTALHRHLPSLRMLLERSTKANGLVMCTLEVLGDALKKSVYLCKRRHPRLPRASKGEGVVWKQ
jgi:hypothetical protein